MRWVQGSVFFFTFQMIVKNFIWVRCWAFAVDGCARKQEIKRRRREKNWKRHGERMSLSTPPNRFASIQLKLASVVMASVGRKSNMKTRAFQQRQQQKWTQYFVDHLFNQIGRLPKIKVIYSCIIRICVSVSVCVCLCSTILKFQFKGISLLYDYYVFFFN